MQRDRMMDGWMDGKQFFVCQSEPQALAQGAVSSDTCTMSQQISLKIEHILMSEARGYCGSNVGIRYIMKFAENNKVVYLNENILTNFKK